MARAPAILRSELSMNFCPAEARVDRHDQHQIDQIDHLFQDRQRSGRIEHHPGLGPQLTDAAQGAVQVRPAFGVDRQDIGPGVAKRLQPWIDRRDHQMHVERQGRMRPDRLYDVWPQGDVGHEMPVHHIHMNPVGARRLQRADFFAQPRKVAGEDRRTDQRSNGHGLRDRTGCGREQGVAAQETRSSLAAKKPSRPPFSAHMEGRMRSQPSGVRASGGAPIAAGSAGAVRKAGLRRRKAMIWVSPSSRSSEQVQ